MFKAASFGPFELDFPKRELRKQGIRPDVWASIRTEKTHDLSVQLALTKFGKRPRFSMLTRDVQRDVRDFFGTYRMACNIADETLFQAGNRAAIESACRGSPIGKKTPTALYLHVTALHSLVPILRIYEGCARTLTGYLEGANIVKLHRDKPAVSYLWYPNFDDDGHPSLSGAFIVYLDSLQVHYRDYSQLENPPILHRKEEFVLETYPNRNLFSELTRQEEVLRLYDNPAEIGTALGWEYVLRLKGVTIRGHRVSSTDKGEQ